MGSQLGEYLRNHEVTRQEFLLWLLGVGMLVTGCEAEGPVAMTPDATSGLTPTRGVTLSPPTVIPTFEGLQAKTPEPNSAVPTLEATRVFLKATQFGIRNQEFEVKQQPEDVPTFLSTKPDKVTQYDQATTETDIALMFHNTGEIHGMLMQLKTGDSVYVDVNNEKRTYQLIMQENFEAMSPMDPRSNFRQIDSTNPPFLTYKMLFNRVYRQWQQQLGGGLLVIQTCFTYKDDPFWGRSFYFFKRIG
jgi:hypothetical protein